MPKRPYNYETKVCGECGKDINYPFEKVYRLEEWPAVHAYEDEFCSSKCMVSNLLCRVCKHMVGDTCELNPKCVLDDIIRDDLKDDDVGDKK